MSRKTLGRLWIVTGVVIVLLGAATFNLAARARNQAMLHNPLYLIGESVSVRLYAEPNENSQVVAVVSRGSLVVASDMTSHRGGAWYLVSKPGMKEGWVPASRLSLKPAEE